METWMSEEFLDFLMQGALAVLEAALVSNVTPLSPITKAIGQLQTAILKSPNPDARAAPTPKQTPVPLWSSLRPGQQENDWARVTLSAKSTGNDAPCTKRVSTSSLDSHNAVSVSTA